MNPIAYVHSRALHLLIFAVVVAAGCSQEPGGPWISDSKILVTGEINNVGIANQDCRSAICPHNENTDLTVWNGVIYLVHRTALSQILGPNSALHIYQSTDSGQTFTDVAQLLALDASAAPPDGRDLRDPAFFQLGNELWLKALTRLPVTSTRDTGVDTRAVVSHTSDGINWSPLTFVGPEGYSFWRIKEHAGVYYTAAYQDGDLSVTLYSSTDGMNWTQGPLIYGVSADTPLETELVFLPDESLLALVRMDGTDAELLGAEGRLRTKVCTSPKPYSSFDCTYELDGERLDGPVAWFWNGRLFVLAREHIGADDRKRTTLFELTGALGPGMTQAPGLIVHAQLPSAGDTSYAGIAPLGGSKFLATWYSSNTAADPPWYTAMFGPSDIWQATLDLAALPAQKVYFQ